MFYLYPFVKEIFLSIWCCLLQLISDECRYVLFECQKVCSGASSAAKRGMSPADTLAVQQMACTWDALNNSIAQMQVSDSHCKLLFNSWSAKFLKIHLEVEWVDLWQLL